MKTVQLVFLLCFGLVTGTQAQSVLDRYIRQGLDSNLAVRQKNFNIDKARLDLKRAQALFYPQLNFSAQYTVANGGRTSDLPIGDLLNGVYSTLNQLTGSSKFPQVPNQTIQFLPNDFHETKLELLLPVLNTDIRNSQKIQQENIINQQQQVQTYKRELVKNIKQAYYQYLQTETALGIYKNALLTVQENLRFNEKLVKNNVATKEVIARAKTELSRVETSITEAENNRKNAMAYFNFLLNKPLDAPIETDSSLLPEPAMASAATAVREELLQLQSVQKIIRTQSKMYSDAIAPKLNLAYQVGFQGFGYKFNDKQFYQLAALQLQWNIFKGYDNRYRIRQAKIDEQTIATQYSDVQKQFELQEIIARNQYQSSLAALKSVAAEMQSTKETYQLTEKRYREGQGLLIELTDARTQMTNAEIKYSLAKLTVLSREAEWERAKASYPVQ
jgi:outer membrane protein